MINNRSAPSYQPAKKLNRILQQHLNLHNHYTIINSSTLAQDLTKLSINKKHRLITLDIKYLYVNIPITEATDIATIDSKRHQVGHLFFKYYNDEWSNKHNNLSPLTPNDLYMSRTAPLTSKRCILYTYSTNIGTEYFKHAVYSPFFFSSSKCSFFHNANFFGSCIIHILYTGVLKLKKNNNSGAKGLKPNCYCTYHKGLTFRNSAFCPLYVYVL